MRIGALLLVTAHAFHGPKSVVPIVGRCSTRRTAMHGGVRDVFAVSLTTGAGAAWVARRRGADGALAAAVGALAAAHVVNLPGFARDLALRLRLALARRRRGVHEADAMRARVLPSDIDRNGHMNNARYFAATNFARRRFWELNGVWRACRRRGANLIVSAQSVRYRRELRCWAAYEVVTRLVHADDKERSFFVEHRFVREGFVCAVQLVKYRIVPMRARGGGGSGGDDATTPSALLLAVADSPDEARFVDDVAAAPPPDLAAWIEYNARSSAALRPAKPPAS